MSRGSDQRPAVNLDRGVDHLRGETLPSRNGDQFVSGDTKKSLARGLDVNGIEHIKSTPELLFGRPRSDATVLLQTEEAAVRAEINALRRGQDFPDVGELLIRFRHPAQQGNELHDARGIRLQIAKVPLAAHVNSPLPVTTRAAHADRTNDRAVREPQSSPVDAVELQESVGIAKVHHSPGILGQRPVLRRGPVIPGGIMLKCESAGFRIEAGLQ